MPDIDSGWPPGSLPKTESKACKASPNGLDGELNAALFNAPFSDDAQIAGIPNSSLWTGRSTYSPSPLPMPTCRGVIACISNRSIIDINICYI
jgi:hypothetical protein